MKCVIVFPAISEYFDCGLPPYSRIVHLPNRSVTFVLDQLVFFPDSKSWVGFRKVFSGLLGTQDDSLLEDFRFQHQKLNFDFFCLLKCTFEGEVLGFGLYLLMNSAIFRHCKGLKQHCHTPCTLDFKADKLLVLDPARYLLLSGLCSLYMYRDISCISCLHIMIEMRCCCRKTVMRTCRECFMMNSTVWTLPRENGLMVCSGEVFCVYLSAMKQYCFLTYRRWNQHAS